MKIETGYHGVKGNNIERLASELNTLRKACIEARTQGWYSYQMELKGEIIIDKLGYFNQLVFIKEV